MEIYLELRFFFLILQKLLTRKIMIKIDKTMSKAEAINYVSRNYSLNEIIETLVEFIMNEYTEPITISREQFQKFFKIRGIKELNLNTMQYVEENRGRARNSPFAQREYEKKRGIEGLPKIDLNEI